MEKLYIDSLPVLELTLGPLTDPIYIVDTNFNLLWVNQVFRSAFGYRPRKPLPCHQVTQMDICGTDACVLTRCVRSGQANQYQETQVGGSTEPDASCLAGGTALYDRETGEVVAVIGVMRDNSAEVRMHKRYQAMLAVERDQKVILERMVDERTAELVSANDALNKTNIDLGKSRREVADILENISQAILTIDSNLLIGREYSKYSEQLFGSDSLEGSSILDLIVPATSYPEERSELEEWLKLVFHSPTLNWDTARSMVQSEYRLRRDDGRISELKIEFEPIREEQRIKRLMVLVEDLTEKRQLQRAIDAKQAEINESLDHLADLAKLDPELYDAIFEEAGEIVDRATASLVALRETQDKTAVIDSMFRDMHTLKGNAMSFGLVRVAAKAHWVEDAFSELRDSAEVLTEELIVQTEAKVRELGQLFERIQSMASRVLSRTPGKDNGAVRALNRDAKIEISHERLDWLGDWATKSLPAGSELDELLARIRSLAMVPLGRLYGRFPKMVEDLAFSLGKNINPIELEGADIAIDARVLNMFASALVHIIRNCVDHGIEGPEERARAGRPAYGTIRLKSYYEGDRLCVQVEDDGAGIDAAKLVASAKEKGLLGVSEQPGDQEALQLIFKPGFSTAEEITDTSGRGVGMDVVRSLLNELEGDIRVETRLGRGTTFHLWIPISVANGPSAALASSAMDIRV